MANAHILPEYSNIGSDYNHVTVAVRLSRIRIVNIHLNRWLHTLAFVCQRTQVFEAVVTIAAIFEFSFN
jgi:hypothetical protein